MNLTSYGHRDYEHESPLRTPEKQTQSNPTLQHPGNPHKADPRRTSSEPPAPPPKINQTCFRFFKSPQNSPKTTRFSHFFARFSYIFSFFRRFSHLFTANQHVCVELRPKAHEPARLFRFSFFLPPVTAPKRTLKIPPKKISPSLSTPQSAISTQ